MDGHAGLSGLRARKLCPPTASPLFAQSNLDNLPSRFNFKTYQFFLFLVGTFPSVFLIFGSPLFAKSNLPFRL